MVFLHQDDDVFHFLEFFLRGSGRDASQENH
jgi:hypothetical protein